MLFRLFLFGLVIFTIACGKSAKKGMMPEIEKADSAAFMFYHQAGQPRFFNLAKVNNMASLKDLVEDANSNVITVKDSCPTQGKVYFYGKGDAVYPLYFTTEKNCMIFSFIKTGEKYSVKMSEASLEKLKELEKQAKPLP
jgi:hypothetical protein